MTAIVNPYFPKAVSTEQGLYEGLITEAIQTMGHMFYYLPRNLQIENPVLNEDVVSKFELAIPIEMYMVDAQGFQGDKEIFSKFGLEIRNSFTLVVAKNRWETEVKSMFDGTATPQAAFQVKTYLRPQEGDLLYDPLTKGLYEIKFVDHDVEFYKLGKNYMYHLSCEAFQYASENVNTGITDIDVFAGNSIDTLKYQLLSEAGEFMVTEGSPLYDYILQDIPADVPTRTYGTDFATRATAIEFNPQNPFGE